MGRAIDIDKLQWYTADKQIELIEQAIADVVTPFVVNRPTVEPELKNQEIYMTSATNCGAEMTENSEYSVDHNIQCVRKV